jgi:hypothetical protein
VSYFRGFERIIENTPQGLIKNSEAKYSANPMAPIIATNGRSFDPKF